MRKTKIICTLGPATEKTQVLRQLIQKGADVFRLNMSHASHEWVRDIVPRIRALAREMGRPIALLLDTQGPAIRTGDLKENLHLKPGDILELTVRGARKKERYSTDVNYDGFVDRQRLDQVTRARKGEKPDALQGSNARHTRITASH